MPQPALKPVDSPPLARWWAALIGALFLAGCQAFPNGWEGESEQQQAAPPPQVATEIDLIQMSHTMADAMVAELKKNQPTFHKSKPVLATTFVDLKDVDNSSELGMVVSDQIASRFTQHGYSIVETRMRNDVAIIPQRGEFILSRDIQRLSQAHQAFAVIVGNYTVSGGLIYFTSKIVRINDSQVLASINAKAPVTNLTRDLLIETGCCKPLSVVDK